jgi:hypothetical protein
VPGRRNLARELAAHDLAGRLVSSYAAMRQHLPEFDRALIGHRAILDYLHAFGIRRPSGRPLQWRTVLRWRRDLCFPLVAGGWHHGSGARYAAVTSSHAVAAWLCSQFSMAHNRFTFSVAVPGDTVPVGRGPTERDVNKVLRSAA